MQVTAIHSFLVSPNDKDNGNSELIRGTPVEPEDALFDMMRQVFNDAPRECQYDICFSHDEHGRQENACLSLLFEHIQTPDLDTGRAIAERLKNVTTKRSGLGLLFLILGRQDDRFRIVVSRFPADQGILAQEEQSSLSVQFVEQIFMKNTKAYKSAVYEGRAIEEFWTGRAVDKQISGAQAISAYWIQEFLMSDFATTGERGTRQLASALRKAINRETNLEVTEQISSAVSLSNKLDNEPMSISSYAEHFGMSEAATSAIRAQVKQSVFEEQFRFLHDEFRKHITFRTVELDNGATLSALSDEFDEVFDRSEHDDGTVEFSTIGEIKKEKLRKNRV